MKGHINGGSTQKLWKYTEMVENRKPKVGGGYMFHYEFDCFLCVWCDISVGSRLMLAKTDEMVKQHRNGTSTQKWLSVTCSPGFKYLLNLSLCKYYW